MQEHKAPSNENPKALDFSDPGSTEDSVIERLQTELIRTQDKANEERFFWICGLILIVNFFTFGTMQSWSGPIAIAVIEILVLVPLGRKLGVDSIWTLTEKFLDKWDGKSGL